MLDDLRARSAGFNPSTTWLSGRPSFLGQWRDSRQPTAPPGPAGKMSANFGQQEGFDEVVFVINAD
jgi:hypothetical protein